MLRPNLTNRPENPAKPADRRGQVLFINADAEFHAGRAQNYLRPEHIEKIVTVFERYEDMPGYARRVPVAEIADPANDWNLNIRRYVDNAPPPEPQDVRAHLYGGVPSSEVEARRPLFDAVGLDPARLFVPRLGTPSPRTVDGRGDVTDLRLPSPLAGEGPGERGPAYLDFHPDLTDRAAIRRLIEADPGVQARTRLVRETLETWWSAHSTLICELPARRNLNAVRAEILASFVSALEPLAVLDHFRLAGVIAAWWTDTLPDFKTLLENGFPGVIDGWIDAIADALEDDDNSGPAFDPFGHKLVLRTMADYLEKISQARAEIARLKGDKATFEADNPPDDLDEDELANWNQASDLERQARELRAEYKASFAELKRLEAAARKPIPKRARSASYPPAGGGGSGERVELERRLEHARATLAPVLARLKDIAEALEPYEETKADLAEARKRYRALLNDFLGQLKAACDAMGEDEKCELVLELFTQDVRIGLDVALNDRLNEVTRFVDKNWEKYRVPWHDLTKRRDSEQLRLEGLMFALGFR